MDGMTVIRYCLSGDSVANRPMRNGIKGDAGWGLRMNSGIFIASYSDIFVFLF